MLLGGMAVFLLVSIGYAEDGITTAPTGPVESALAPADAAPPALPPAMVIANLVMNTPPIVVPPPLAPPPPPAGGPPIVPMPLFPDLEPGPSSPGPDEDFPILPLEGDAPAPIPSPPTVPSSTPMPLVPGEEAPPPPDDMDLPEDAVDEIDVTIPDDELGLPVLFEEDCGPEVEGPLMPVPDPIGDTDIQIADTLTTEEIITLMEGAGDIG